MNSLERQVLSLFPRQYQMAMSSLSLIELKAKYKINGAKVDKVYNIIVNIAPSAYYPTGKSIVVCKLCDNVLYSPDSGEAVGVDEVELAKNMLLRCMKASCSAGCFGCCSKYKECSDERHCIHENPFYSLGCIYRSHLEEGNIFYGVNRNV